MARIQVTIARCSHTGRRSLLLPRRERQNAGQIDVYTDLQFAVSEEGFRGSGDKEAQRTRGQDICL